MPKRPISSRRRKEAPGKRYPLAMRTTLEVRRAVEDSARASGRSLAQQTEYLIQHAMEQRQLLPQVMSLAYGPTFAGILEVVAVAMRDAALVWRALKPVKTLEDAEAWTSDGMNKWPSDAGSFKAATEAAALVFEAFNPSDEGIPTAEEIAARSGDILGGAAGALAMLRGIAWERAPLHPESDEDHGAFRRKIETEARLRAALDPEILERLRSRLTAWGRTPPKDVRR